MTAEPTETLDVLVVGAGFAGMYQLYRLREAGFSVQVVEAADDVGGTWFWNRYPGARCDILSVDYSFSFDPDLQREWQWSERYATQPEILRYAQHVADRFDLRRDIRFNTRVTASRWLEDRERWQVTTDSGDLLEARFLIMATGCLSMPKTPDIPGAERFRGEVYTTSRWPHEGVDFTGQRVAVIGTGSSGIQSIPLIAEQAESVTVFQRTPNFTVPASNGPIADERIAAWREDPEAYRDEARWSNEGVPRKEATVSALEVSEEERTAAFERAWKAGELMAANSEFTDLVINAEANDTFREFVHGKIRGIVKDPEVAETLCPTSFHVFTKRLCLDTNYYATFNRPNVHLVDLRRQPIQTVTESGIEFDGGGYDVDAIVYATGFDAMTGALVGVDITGRDGETLKDKWAHGPTTYLGLTTVGFPNLFMITGPGSPSVLSNMMVSIEQHVEWISRVLEDMRDKGHNTIEPTKLAEERWVQHCNEFADTTLFPSADSWYTGANVPGKPRVFLPYVGGVGRYRAACEEVIARGYLGFVLEGPAGRQVNDGIIRELKPDVQVLLEEIAKQEPPPLETLGVEGLRKFLEDFGATMPPGPEVGEIVDGTLAGADGGALEYRLYRPGTPGPHPVVAYFHGGGWVCGSAISDDPLCRDLCNQTDAIIVSVDYRHAPEAAFPAAADDGLAAVRWIAEHAAEIGAIPGALAVAGWSAGGNVAAVTAQRARDAGPMLCGQLLLTPVTDCDLSRPSYLDNAEGYVLTTPLMGWFWNQYCPEAKRSDPKASPLRATDLGGLPPAMVVTAQFDPLRDEGDAYAEALAAAGVPVQHLPCPGQIHSSITMVGLLPTTAPIREKMAAALKGFFAGIEGPGDIAPEADAVA